MQPVTEVLIENTSTISHSHSSGWRAYPANTRALGSRTAPSCSQETEATRADLQPPPAAAEQSRAPPGRGAGSSGSSLALTLPVPRAAAQSPGRQQLGPLRDRAAGLWGASSPLGGHKWSFGGLPRRVPAAGRAARRPLAAVNGHLREGSGRAGPCAPTHPHQVADSGLHGRDGGGEVRDGLAVHLALLVHDDQVGDLLGHRLQDALDGARVEHGHGGGGGAAPSPHKLRRNSGPAGWHRTGRAAASAEAGKRGGN